MDAERPTICTYIHIYTYVCMRVVMKQICARVDINIEMPAMHAPDYLALQVKQFTRRHDRYSRADRKYFIKWFHYLVDTAQFQNRIAVPWKMSVARPRLNVELSTSFLKLLLIWYVHSPFVRYIRHTRYKNVKFLWKFWRRSIPSWYTTERRTEVLHYDIQYPTS